MRTGVQAFVSFLLTIGPVMLILDAAGIDVDSANVTAFIVPLVMAVYWYVGASLQNSEFVQNNPALRWVIAVLMGGDRTPKYDPIEP